MYDDTPSLAAWRMTELSPDLERRITAHPAFADAVRALISAMRDIKRQHPKFSRMTRDSGHYVGAMLAVYLHCNGGLTMANLKAFCAWSGYLSPGRARAVLLYLQYLGFVEPIATLRQGTSAQWKVKPYLLEVWHLQMRLALEATAPIDPAVHQIADRFAEPGVAEAFTVAHCQSLLAQTHLEGRIVSIRKHFLQRLGGTQVLHHIIFEARESFPPTAPFTLPVTELARDHGVTRMHIRRMVRDARDAGVLVETPEGLTFSDASRSGLSVLFAAQLACLLHAASVAQERLVEAIPMAARA